MASFLNNSGDIILDAVLTDYGRQLLAKGDGSFNIVKFAFGDDEIDYGLYDSTQTTPNQDTNILSTVILEAFTNNIASMNSKLLTIPDNNLLFLPVLKINDKSTLGTRRFFDNRDYYVVPVDVNSSIKETTNALKESSSVIAQISAGVLTETILIVVDQGLDSSQTDPTKSLAGQTLYETEYNIKIDSRLGVIPNMGPAISIDDDLIATYKAVLGGGRVSAIPTTDVANTNTTILGTKGSRLTFGVLPTTTLATTDTYFTRLGSTVSTGFNPGLSSNSFKIIRSSITVEGVTTGYSLQIPIVFAKKG
jgi:hypothetical protein